MVKTLTEQIDRTVVAWEAMGNAIEIVAYVAPSPTAAGSDGPENENYQGVE